MAASVRGRVQHFLIDLTVSGKTTVSTSLKKSHQGIRGPREPLPIPDACTENRTSGRGAIIRHKSGCVCLRHTWALRCRSWSQASRGVSFTMCLGTRGYREYIAERLVNVQFAEIRTAEGWAAVSCALKCRCWLPSHVRHRRQSTALLGCVPAVRGGPVAPVVCRHGCPR